MQTLVGVFLAAHLGDLEMGEGVWLMRLDDPSITPFCWIALEDRLLQNSPGKVEEMKPVTQLKTPYNQNLSENMLNRPGLKADS